MGGAYFLRSETFFDVASAATTTWKDATSGVRFEDAQLLAAFDGRSPHELSHGESFLRLFERRMGAQSLWFMDEPEAPLSFRSSLALLATMHDLAAAGSQLIVATHSPVLLGLPGAAIYELGDEGVERREFHETDAVSHTRSFLDDPERYLRHLLADDG